MHGYTQKSDDKNDLINKNMSVVKKIAYYYLGRVHQVVEIEDLLQRKVIKPKKDLLQKNIDQKSIFFLCSISR